MKLTPMLEQYLRLKQEHPDALLLFRLGDFYELFFEDAERAARALDITLTTRSKKDEVPIPMCGVPHHSVQPHIARLLASGFKVALCEQMEDPSTAKGLVSRELVRVITPGTLTEEEHLDPKQPNYLVAVHAVGGLLVAVSADLSTGELGRQEPADEAALAETLSRLAPREVLLDPALTELDAVVRRAVPNAMVSPVPAGRFDVASGEAWLRRTAPERDPDPALAAALGALLWYLGETHRASIDHLRAPRDEETAALMVIDEATRRNLELLATTRGERRGSLLEVIDETVTPMGGRLLRQWMLAPLTDVPAIGARLDAVEDLLRQPTRRQTLADRLGSIGDLERLTARLAAGRVGPRDLVGLAAALGTVEGVRDLLEAAHAAALRDCRENLDDLPRVRERIGLALADDPPLNPRAGGLIRAGFDTRVDELRDLAHSGKRFFSEFERRERERTGIASLKVRYNQVFGYYIEVTRPNLPLVPPEYRRKQTLANAERFVTPELETYEARVLGAEERLAAVEAELLAALVTDVAAEHASLSRTAGALARIDVFAGLALVAERRRYCRPQVTRDRRLLIEEGRHPVVEAMAGRGGFVANDCQLDPDVAADLDPDRAQHGGQVDVSPAGGPDRPAGADGGLRSRRKGRDRGGRPPVHPHRRLGQPRRRRVHLHGRDEGDRRHPAPAERSQSRHSRRDRTRHQHLRRHLHRLGRGRAHARSRRRAAARALRDPLPRADRPGAQQGARAQLLGRGAGVEGRGRLPAPHRSGAGQPELRYPGGASGRRAGLDHRSCQADPRQSRVERAERRRTAAPGAGERAAGRAPARSVRRRRAAPVRGAGRHRRERADAGRRPHPVERAGPAGAPRAKGVMEGRRAGAKRGLIAALWLLQALAIATPAAAGRPAELRQIRPIVADDYTRLVIELTHRVRYDLKVVPADAATRTPARLYVDLHGTRLPRGEAPQLSPAGGPLLRLRATQVSSDLTRLILDVPGLRDPLAFPMLDPFRLIVDVRGDARPLPRTARASPLPPAAR